MSPAETKAYNALVARYRNMGRDPEPEHADSDRVAALEDRVAALEQLLNGGVPKTAVDPHSMMTNPMASQAQDKPGEQQPSRSAGSQPTSLPSVMSNDGPVQSSHATPARSRFQK